MGNKILIAYASKYGSTGEVAQAIGQSLSQKGLAVDVRPVKSVASLDKYSAVILGSAIRFGQWLPEAVGFAKKFQAQLNQIPNAFFTVHILNTGAEETSLKTRSAYLDPVRALVKPGAEAFFTGKVDLDQLSLVERIMAKATKSPAGDLRDWAAIQAWAEAMAPALGSDR